MRRFTFLAALPLFLISFAWAQPQPQPPDVGGSINVTPRPVASDKSVKLDYDIVYVRAPRYLTSADGKQRPTAWPEIAHPFNISAAPGSMVRGSPTSAQRDGPFSGRGART